MKLPENLPEKLLGKLSGQPGRRILTVSMFVLLLILMFTLIHTAYAGRLSISLNSPVSFPVDI